MGCGGLSQDEVTIPCDRGGYQHFDEANNVKNRNKRFVIVSLYTQLGSLIFHTKYATVRGQFLAVAESLRTFHNPKNLVPQKKWQSLPQLSMWLIYYDWWRKNCESMWKKHIVNQTVTIYLRIMIKVEFVCGSRR